MVTGYEAGMYRDIERMRSAMERIAKAVEIIALPEEHLTAEQQFARAEAARVFATLEQSEPPKPEMPVLTATRRAELMKSIRREMYGAAVSLLGTGYVPDYYSGAASDFVQIAEHAIDEVLRGDWT